MTSPVVYALRENCSIVYGVPDSEFAPIIKDLGSMYYGVSRENHAVAMAFGNRVGGGRPCVMMQNTGLGLIGGAVYDLQRLYGVGMFALISNRGVLEREEPQHHLWGEKTRSWLSVLGFSVHEFKDRMDVIREASNYAYDKEKLVAVLVDRGEI